MTDEAVFREYIARESGKEGVVPTLGWDFQEGQEIGLSIGGLDSRTGEHLSYEAPELRGGDRVTIEIIETDVVDPESSRSVPDLSGCG